MTRRERGFSITNAAALLPAPDKMAVKGTDNTSVAARYLPQRCRATTT